MKLQVLLSAMHLKSYEYIDSLHITGDCVVINQCDEDQPEQMIVRSDGQRIMYVCTTQRGLSKSRNMAVELADEDICIFCDNDVEYVPSYETIILDAFERNKDADMLVFFIKRKVRQQPNFPVEKTMDWYSTMKIFSPEIAFRRSSITNIQLNELFGAGALFHFGEENIFLFDCLRAGLTIRYIPEQIAQLRDEQSTWFQGYDERYFITRGANYYAMSRAASIPLILQFALRKRSEYGTQMGMLCAVQTMLRGRNEYKKNHMRLFLVGDDKTGTGPANVNKNYLRYLPNDTLKLKHWNKLLRVWEIFYKTWIADAVIFSGYSGQNVIGLRFAHILRKPAVYLMHGCVEHENAINGVPDEKMNAIERKTMALADEIWAVSKTFCGWLKEHYPQFGSKIYYAENGVDWLALKGNSSQDVCKRDDKTLLSIGGGMPRKKILSVCRAIEWIHVNTQERLKLIVIGDEGLDTSKINQYSFAQNLGLVPFETTRELFYQSKLFIQNSCFETFGLAPLEALACGCDLLLSKEVGVISLFTAVTEVDIINDWNDKEEIGRKILHVLRAGNHERLTACIDKESVSWKTRTKQLVEQMRLKTGKKY